jgi:hypothetical protein
LPAARLAAPGVPFARSPEAMSMMDVVYLTLTAGLFALTWGLVRLCERV